MRTRARWMLLCLALVLVFDAFLATPEPAAAQEGDDTGEAIQFLPWEGYDPGPPPANLDGRYYTGRGDSTASRWEVDGACQHRYYDYGTPYWDCRAKRDTCTPDDFGDLDAAGFSASHSRTMVSLGELRHFYAPAGWEIDRFTQDAFDRVTGNHDPFVVCEARNGIYSGSCAGEGDRCIELKEARGEGDDVEIVDHRFVEDGKRYIICTHRPSWRNYGTDWMHCPTDGFRTISCIETQGLGMNLGGFQIGDENSGVGHSVTNFFSDDQSAVIVPDHNHAGARGAHGDITWWYRSVMLEGTEEGGKGCSLAKTPPDTRTCQDIHQERETERALLQQYASELHSDADIEAYQARVAEVDRIGTGGSLVPDECWGTYPTNAYGIVYDAGSAFNPGQWAERVMGWIAEFAFGFGKLVILAALWLTKLSLTFDVTSYADTVDSLANRFDSRLLDIDMSFVSGGDTSMSMGVVAGVDTMSIKLSDIAWFALFAVAGYLALRGKAVRAGGEVLMSIVLFGLAGVLIASATSVGGYFYSAANLVDVSAKGVLLAGYGCDPNLDLGHDETVQLLRGDLDESGCDDRGDQPEGWSGVGGAIHHEFVERPYQWVNWGREELSNDCSVAQSQILSLSGMRSTSYAARHMERAGCVDEANHSREMTTTRLMSTLFAMTVASIVGILLILIAGTLLVAKFIVALLFAMSPFAAAVAVLPGRGRGLAFWWVATLIQAWLAAMVVGFVVAVLLIGMEGIQSTTQDRDLAERWAIMLLLVVVLWMLFKKTRNATQNTAQTVAERLTQATGAGAAWAGAGAGGGSLDFSSVDRAGTAGARMGMRGAMATGRAGMRAASMARRTAGAPIRGAWRTGAQRRRENRQMHKSVLGATIGRELTGDVAPGSWRRLGKRPSARKIQQVGADSRGWVHGRRIHDSHANSRAAATGVVVAPYQGGRPITFQPPTGGGQGGAAGNQGGGNQGGGAGQAGGNQGRGGSWVGAGGNQGGSVPAGGQVGGQRQRGGPAEPRSAKDVKRQLNNDLKEVQAVVKGGRDIQGSALEAAHRLGMTSGDLANYHGSNRDKFAQKEVVTRARDGRSNALAKDRFERASSNDQQRTSSIKRNRRRSDVDRARATVEANQVYVSDPDSPFGRAAQRNIDQANAVLQQEGSEAGEGPR